MELGQHGNSVLPTLPGNSDLAVNEHKVLILYVRKRGDATDFYEQYLSTYRKQLGDVEVGLMMGGDALIPLAALLDEIQCKRQATLPGVRRLSIMLLPYQESRATARLGDWHYLVTGTKTMFVVENLDTGDAAPQLINGLLPPLFATAVVPRKGAPTIPLAETPPAPQIRVQVTVSGYGNTGKSHVLAVIEAALRERWPNKHIELSRELEDGGYEAVQERLADNQSPEIPATTFELRELYRPLKPNHR